MTFSNTVSAAFVCSPRALNVSGPPAGPSIVRPSPAHDEWERPVGIAAAHIAVVLAHDRGS
jgi:hypothetical protein